MAQGLYIYSQRHVAAKWIVMLKDYLVVPQVSDSPKLATHPTAV